MFDAGFLEMLIIGIIALLVVGPERLPGVAAKAGKMVGKMKAFIATTREDIEKELRAEELKNMLVKQKEEISELRDMMQNTKDEAQKSFDDVKGNLDDASRALKSNITDAKSSVKD